jgi:hypothetical protein
MSNYIVYNTSGEILRTGSCQPMDVGNQAGNGEFVMVGDANDVTQLIVNGQVVDKPIVINPPLVFNLVVAQSKKLEQLNQDYNKANTATFTYLGVIYNADSIAQNNLNSTANYINQFHAFPTGFPNVWLSDAGDVLPLPSVADFWPLYQAYVAQGVYNITHFAMLKSQVLALPSTATQADLDLIVW